MTCLLPKVTAAAAQRAFLGRLAAFAARCGVADHVTPVLADLRTPAGLAVALAAVRAADLVLACRFLDRPLLAALSREARPGAFVGVHHFLVGAASQRGRALSVDEVSHGGTSASTGALVLEPCAGAGAG